ncbi:MAG: hypothetical protein RL346_1243 [Verrucomicrobiota bacterium]|jgi:uncharacterized protein (DUF1800 family)
MRNVGHIGLKALCLACGISGSMAAPVSFVTKEVEYRLGECVMIPLECSTPASETTALELKPQKPGMVEIIRQPEILKDQQMGFARIRTCAPGEVVLKCGEASLSVRVTEERPVALMRKLTPRFTSPASNSSVWGIIHVGAEIWVGAPGVDRASVPDARLVLPDGTELAPKESFPPIDGPFWRMVYEVDTTRLPQGECRLILSCKPLIATGSSQGRLLLSEEHPINILHVPKKDEWIITGECEDFVSTPRSERMGPEAPMVIMDAAASKHRAVTLRSNRHSWVLQPEIPEDGNYQIMVRARGTLFGSAYASLGVILGENITDSGSVRICTSAWQRVPVGRPVALKKGRQWIGIALANEFRYRNQSLRHADVDHFEIRRVGSGSAGGGGMMMGGMMMQSADAKTAAGNGRTATRLQCAFTSIHDGEKINGRIELRASLQSPSLKNDTDYQEIRSDLWINDAYFATAYGRHVSFPVYPHDLKQGENKLFVQSVSPCGNTAVSLPQRLIASTTVKKPQVGYDVDLWDLQRKGWDKIKRVDLKKEDPLATEEAPASIHLLSDPAASVQLRLPNELVGKRRISLLSRLAPEIENGSLVIKLHQPKAAKAHLREITIAKPDAPNHWTSQALGEVEFFSGQKFIRIELTAGQVALGGLSIDKPKFLDAAAPLLQVLYPKPNAKLSSQGDAIIVDAFDDLKLSHFEVQIDGVKAPLAFPVSRDAGANILHLPASLLETGKRRIEIVAIDTWGKETRSAPIPVEVREVSKSTLDLPYPRAVRLANRLAYGQDPLTMISILTQGEDLWLNRETTSSWGSTHDQLCEAHARLWFADGGDSNLRGRVISHLLTTRNPVRHRFSLFAQNHFSTWMAKTGAGAKWRENQEFRDAGITRFNDLLLTSATSPAMMVYLDQQNSLALQLNENYAREVMELHTVGVHGGYQQSDVTNLAHLLTGWGAQREATMDGMAMDYNYRFSPYLNEDQPFEIFGLSIPKSDSLETSDDRIAQIIEMLSCRPQTARFISEKLAGHYMGLPTQPEVVDAMSREYLRTNGDLRSMLAVMIRSPRFMATDAPPKVMTPVDYGITMQRISNSFHPWSVIGLADRSGRNLFDRASPDGYPEKNEDYADSNYQLQKWSFCKELEQSLANSLAAGWFDPETIKDPAHRDTIIDHALAARRGAAPSANTRAALHAMLSQEIADPNQHRIVFASFLHMMPEFQIR